MKKERTQIRTKKSTHFYLSYNLRFIIHLILFFLFFLLGIYFIIHSMDVIQTENVYYQEEGKVDYSVCLKENNFYETKCIDKGMSYIASLIENIPIEFNYRFMLSDDQLLNKIEYEIVAKLTILDKENTTNYYEKKYTIQEKNSDSVRRNGKYYILNKEISIPYDDYNKIANSFKSQYGVDAESYLEVFLITYHQVNGEYQIPTSSMTSIKIPLSEKAIQIQLAPKEVEQNQNNTITKTEFSLVNGIYLFIGIISIIFSLIYIVVVIRMIYILKSKKGDYDKCLEKILKEYDRLIVETTSFPKEEYNLLKIKSFEELLDVHDNLKLPIMHYNIVAHHKSKFYILQDKNLYLFTLKSSDLSKNKNL